MCVAVEGSEILDEDYHFYREIKIDNLSVGVAGNVGDGAVHFTDDFFGIVLCYEAGEIFTEACFLAVEIKEVGHTEVIHEVLAYEPLGIVIEFYLLLPAEGGKIGAPFF